MRSSTGAAATTAALWRRLLRGPFDACVDFTGRDRSALMTLAARAPRRVIARQLLRGGGWRRLVYNTVVDTSLRSRHTVDLYLDQLVALDLRGMPHHPGRARLPPAPVLRLPPGADARAKEILAAHGIGADGDFIVIHPGSARAEKYWLPERWAEVITFCQRELGRRCVLTGGRDAFEQEHLARVHAALAGRASLPRPVRPARFNDPRRRARAGGAVRRGGLGADAPRGGVASAADRPVRADEPLPLACRATKRPACSRAATATRPWPRLRGQQPRRPHGPDSRRVR